MFPSVFTPRIKEKTLLAFWALYPIYSLTDLACSDRRFCDVPLIKDTHREKGPSNENPVLTKSTIMGIWVVGTSNQLFKTGF